jgi:Na+/melibiose symporter-like transporter
MLETIILFMAQFPIISIIGFTICPVLAWLMIGDVTELDMWKEKM